MANVDLTHDVPPSSQNGTEATAAKAPDAEPINPASEIQVDAINGAGKKSDDKEANKVEEFFPGKRDSGGRLIDTVYFKRDDYAIYRSGGQILVVYSDTKATADKQIAAVSSLLPLRDHLANLIRDLPQESARNNYFAQMADALRLGLENQSDAAKAIIDEAVRDALETQARIGRLVYLKWATLLALVVAVVLIPTGGAYIEARSGVHLLLMATGAGAVGALLSIAIAIRGRTVAIDGDWQANAVDAAIRVMIGIISAAVLYLLLSSGVLSNVQAGSVTIAGGDIHWQVALLIGFAAGFLERLVPDLLEKSTGAATQTSPAAPTSSGGVVSPAPAKTGS